MAGTTVLNDGAPKTVRQARWYFGGLAGSMAACCTHPLDLLKVSFSLVIELFEATRKLKPLSDELGLEPLLSSKNSVLFSVVS